MKKRSAFVLLVVFCLVAVVLRVASMVETDGEPLLAFEFEVQSDEFVARVRNVGSDPVRVRSVGQQGELDPILIEILDENQQTVFSFCGTGSKPEWTRLAPGESEACRYSPEVFTAIEALKPGDSFYLSVFTKMDSEMRPVISREKIWPHKKSFEMKYLSAPTPRD